MTNKRFCKIKKKNILILLIVVIVLILLSYVYKKYYNVEDRVSNVNKFVNVDNSTAESWIRVQGTNIDLPVLYYYNVENISDVTNDIAWTYTENKNKSYNRITIFSHNVLNVSNRPLIGEKSHKRFEQLMSYIYLDFVKENKYVQFTIDGNNYLYKIYAISIQETDNINYYDNNFSKKKLKEYIKNAKKNSYFDFDIEVDENDQLLTLMTCTRFFGESSDYSFVVDARRLRKNELVKNYKVEETDNYADIKKIMEGTDEDV